MDGNRAGLTGGQEQRVVATRQGPSHKGHEAPVAAASNSFSTQVVHTVCWLVPHLVQHRIHLPAVG